MTIPIAIRGIEYAVPKLKITNDDLTKILDTSDEWIRPRTGIENRHLASGEDSCITFANEVARKIIKSTNIDPLSIDMIISATSAPERCYPSVACEVQAEIGADNASAFDLVAACSGMLYAMQMARANIMSGFAKRVLVIASDTTTKFLDWTDRTSCVLFGDGASGMIMEVSPDEKDDIVTIDLEADGKYKEYIYLDMPRVNCPLAEKGKQPEDYFIHMAGKDVYKYVMKKIPAIIKQTLKNANMTIDDIDYFIPHQANLRMIEALSKRIGISDEKVLHNLEEYGNISAASIPCVIKEKLDTGILKTPSTLLLSAFGAGMTSGGAIIKLQEHSFEK